MLGQFCDIEAASRLPARGMTIGGHGANHQPIARTLDAAADLRRSQADLAKRTDRRRAFPEPGADGACCRPGEGESPIGKTP